MHEPPKKARKGLKSHVRDINALREFVLKTRLMPEQGFEETASGIKPPIGYKKHIPQFSPGFARSDRETGNGQTFFFFRRGGVVYVPYHSGDGVTQIPLHSCVPIIPTMTDYDSAADIKIIISQDGIDAGMLPPKLLAPRRSSEHTGKSVVFLSIPFDGRSENIGTRELSDGSYTVGVEADSGEAVLSGDVGNPQGVGNTGTSSGTGTTHFHPGESDHTHSISNANADWNKLGVPLEEVNYAVGALGSVSIGLMEFINFSADSSTSIKVPLGWFQLDEQGYLIDMQWYQEGAMGPISIPGGFVASGESNAERSDPPPTSPDGSSNYELPG